MLELIILVLCNIHIYTIFSTVFPSVLQMNHEMCVCSFWRTDGSWNSERMLVVFTNSFTFPSSRCHYRVIWPIISIGNPHIQQEPPVDPIVTVIQQAQLWWYGHLKRLDEPKYSAKHTPAMTSTGWSKRQAYLGRHQRETRRTSAVGKEEQPYVERTVLYCFVKVGH